MTDRRSASSDQFLVAWFEDGPTTMPDRVIDVVSDRIGRQRQRHSWRLVRRLDMNAQLKLVTALAAAILVALVGYNLLPKSGMGGPSVPTIIPTPTPAPTSLPSEAPSVAAYPCDDPAFRCAGILAAGKVSTAAFKPAFSFTAPAGWANSLDRERTYSLKPIDNGLFFQVFSQVAIPNQNATCTAERKPGAGTTVADFVEFYTTHPGLVASTPERVTIGGFEGQRVVVHVSPTWKARCPNGIAPAVVLVTDTVTTPDRVSWIDDQYTTMSIIDVAGTTVIIRIESGPTSDAAAQDQARMQPIIDSFLFTP